MFVVRPSQIRNKFDIELFYEHITYERTERVRITSSTLNISQNITKNYRTSQNFEHYDVTENDDARDCWSRSFLPPVAGGMISLPSGPTAGH